MALFNDGLVSSIDDLQGHDTQLLDVANTEAIDVTRKLALAQEEIAVELRVLLARLSGPADPGAVHLGTTESVPSLDQVVVTPPLKLWHTFRTLELVYRDAYNSQLNDRYAGKRDEYHTLTQWAYEKLIQSGIGMSKDPIVRAPMPVLQAAPGAIPDGVYYVASAWTNAEGEEGAPSLPAAISVSGTGFSVRPEAAPSNARGWNVYAGVSPGKLVLQNPVLLQLDAIWTQAGALATAGRVAGVGQGPGYMRPAPRLLQRG
jgi:hypothetical protein